MKVTTLSYVMSLMPDTILKDLEMERHGYRVHPVGPYVVPLPDGRVMIEYDDPKQNYEEFAAINKRDADNLEQWDAWMGSIAEVLGLVLMTTPPHLGSKRPGDLLDRLRLVLRFRGFDVKKVGDVTRLFTMSVSDLLDRFFESEEIEAAMSINGLIGTWAGPREPGTGYVMVHHSIDVGDGTMGSVGRARGRHGRRRTGARAERSFPRRRGPYEREGGGSSSRTARRKGSCSRAARSSERRSS